MGLLTAEWDFKRGFTVQDYPSFHTLHIHFLYFVYFIRNDAKKGMTYIIIVYTAIKHFFGVSKTLSSTSLTGTSTKPHNLSFQ